MSRGGPAAFAAAFVIAAIPCHAGVAPPETTEVFVVPADGAPLESVVLAHRFILAGSERVLRTSRPAIVDTTPCRIQLRHPIRLPHRIQLPHPIRLRRRSPLFLQLRVRQSNCLPKSIFDRILRPESFVLRPRFCRVKR
jgi:hypothetical protein